MREFKKNESLEELLKINDNVFIDFYAVWCGPCKMMHPILEEIEKVTQNVLFLSINVDEHREIAQTFNINAVPTLIMFKDGKEVGKKVGFQDSKSIKELLQK